MSERLSEAEYKKVFEVGKTDGKSKLALEYALDIRKFEIELYWTRAAYFWAFITVAFAGYGAAQTVDEFVNRVHFSVFISCIGLFASFCWFCANRGSKQWQENWENHVDLLEDGVVGPLYKTVTRRPSTGSRWFRIVDRATGPYPYSVSKINQLPSLYVVVAWCFLLIFSVGSNGWNDVLDIWNIGAITITVMAIGSVMRYGRTWTAAHQPTATLRSTTISGP